MIPKNWKDLSCYPSPDDQKVSKEQWTWEFLRRNKDYQAMCRKYQGINTNESLEIWDMFGICELCDPNEEFSGELLRRLWFRPYPPICCVGWDDKLQLTKNRIDDKGGTTFLEQITQPQIPTEVVIKLDIRHDIESCLLEIRHFLEIKRTQLKSSERAQPFPKSLHKHQFPTYLRLLDAEASLSLLDAELIANILPVFANGEIDSYPENRVTKKLRANLKAARRMRDDGYKFLMLDKDLSAFITQLQQMQLQELLKARKNKSR